MSLNDRTRPAQLELGPVMVDDNDAVQLPGGTEIVPATTPTPQPDSGDSDAGGDREHKTKKKKRTSAKERREAQKAAVRARKAKQKQAMKKYKDVRERRLAREAKEKEVAAIIAGKHKEEKVNDKDCGDFRTGSHRAELYTWDYCLVFQVGDPDKVLKNSEQGWRMTEKERYEITTAATITKLHSAGLHTSVYYSVQKDEIYCLVGADEERLEEEADKVDYDIELETNEVIHQGKELDMPLCKHLNTAQHEQDGLSLQSWFTLYGKYDRFEPDDDQYRLFKRRQTEGPLHEDTIFRSVDRLRLTDTIIEADRLMGGAGLSKFACREDPQHSLIKYFPLHQRDKLQELWDLWVKWDVGLNMFEQPISEIRDYFGEKIAFYFAFLSFYCTWLVWPAVVGLGFFIAQMVEGRVDVSAIPFYGIFVAGWAAVFLEFWKRTESYYRVQWGMSSFEAKEQARPEYKGEVVRSPVNGALEKYFSPWKKLWRALLSQSVIWTLIGVVIGSVLSIMLLRSVLVDWSDQWGGIITGILNALQIQVLNVVYGMMATILNDYENHRTQTQYENALIAKSFLFKFVNSYNSLFYIAFIKQYDSTVDYCKDNDCLGELQVQLGTIFISMITINNALEIIIPWAQNWRRARENAAMAEDDGDITTIEEEKPKSEAEKEFELEDYESTFDDFDELAIQYGFVSLFVVAFPLAPMLALFNNYFEMRLDATKLGKISKRPPPDGAANIGTWYDIFTVLSYISVITNVALIVFHVDIIDTWTRGDLAAKVWTFVGLEHVVILLKLAIDYFIPDVPFDVTTHLLRQQFLVDVLINGVEEENERILRMEQEAKKDNDSREESERIVVDGMTMQEFVSSLDHAVPDVVHLWSENTVDKIKGRMKWAPSQDESETFKASDDRLQLHLLLPMDQKVKTGGFVYQPAEFWMMYDLYYLGTVFASQYIYFKYSGNAAMTEQHILSQLMQDGGVEDVAFKNDDFVGYLKWWLDRRRPKWAIYLGVTPKVIDSAWIQRQVNRLQGALSWRFELVVAKDGIIVQPDHV